MVKVWEKPPITTPRELRRAFDPQEEAVWSATFGAFVAHPPPDCEDLAFRACARADLAVVLLREVRARRA